MKRSVASVEGRSEGAGELPARLPRLLDQRWRRFRKAWSSCRRRFSEESVHQLRVEARRLLAFLDLLQVLVHGREVRALQEAVRKLLKRFARLRDTQVQILFLQPHEERLAAARAFAGRLRRREGRLSRKLERKLQGKARRKTKALVGSLRAEVTAAVEAWARRASAETRVRRVLVNAFEQAARLCGQIDPARSLTIHRTRVAFKHYRYLVELLQPWLSWAGDPCLRAMHDYQTMMGEIQDAEVLQQALAKFAKKSALKPGDLVALCRLVARRQALLTARYLRSAQELFQWDPRARSQRGGA
jgi:CHAD domain-containing protein